MYENQQFGNMGFMGGIPQGTGYQFNGIPQGQVPTIKNFLTDEEIQRLVQKENTFSLAITETESLRAKCNHKWQDGIHDAIVETEDGKCVCQICGYEFNPIEAGTSSETLEEMVKDVLDILQTIKMLYFDMSPEIASEFFKIIPLMEKIPKLFEMACKNYAKYDKLNSFGYNNHNMNTMQMFNVLTNVLSGQPMPNAAPQQPVYGQQPMMGYQQPMMSNGFVAQPGYAPTMAGYQYVPNTAAPVADQAATDAGKDVKVDATFKA